MKTTSVVIDKKNLFELNKCDSYIRTLIKRKYSHGRTPNMDAIREFVYNESLELLKLGESEDLPLFFLRSIMSRMTTQFFVIELHDMFTKNMTGEFDEDGWTSLVNTLYRRKSTFFQPTSRMITYDGMYNLVYILRGYNSEKV